jgi:hypothetical protein
MISGGPKARRVSFRMYTNQMPAAPFSLQRCPNQGFACAARMQLPWSSGHVEGQVHRLKLIKRQMYGRAKFDLLRQRVLYAA